MRVLITGITGFAGSHLADYALDQEGVEVYGIRRWRSPTENIDHIADRLNIVECDLRDAASVTSMIDSIRPDRIFHLAAQSYVPTSWHAPAESLETNIIGQLNLFQALRQTGCDATRIQIAGSSEEYGLVYREEAPITEQNPLRPLSPYAVSKVTQDLLAYQYFRSYGTHAIRTRGFNHTGPRRGEVFVVSNFAKQIAMIEAQQRPPVIRVGNLEAERDFTDVRDVVRAYWLILEHGVPGEVYNIASGRTWRIQDVLDLLLSFSETDITAEVDPDRLRPSDVELLLGDASKLNEITGWEPLIPFEQSARET
ncbi:MAG TPA: GDP-mannose 4,6-dehydratase, partial [Acidobacteriota bacterium]|nr:GDP-mannose 4,6-dehydratase [Acidobacteriota bacterium]